MIRREFLRTAAVCLAASHSSLPARSEPTARDDDVAASLTALQRSPVYARRGMVVSSQPLASQVGLDVLRSGGSATDAAIATSAMLCVLDPVTAGLGGHLVGLVHDSVSKESFALRSVGRPVGTLAIPGCIDGWTALHGRFGRKPLAELLATAADLAEAGVVIGDRTAATWATHLPRLRGFDDPTAVSPLRPGGVAPSGGQIVARPDLASTLRLIALRGRSAFYQGDLATPLLTLLNEESNETVTAEMLAAQNAEWLAPTTVRYRDQTIASIPDAVTLLQTLSLLAPYNVAAMKNDSPAYLHLLVEAYRLAAAAKGTLKERLDPTASAQLRRQINPNVARPRQPIAEANVESSSVVAVDDSGGWCVLSNPLGNAFGSGVSLPDTGVLLPTASLPAPPLPVFVMDENEPVAAMSVSGPGQPSLTAARLITAMLDFAQSFPGTVDAFRLQLAPGTTGSQLKLEPGVDNTTLQGLLRRGHDVSRTRDWSTGRVMMVQRRPFAGTLIGVADVRGDAAAVGY